MSFTIYVPCDSSAISLGADRIATSIINEAKKRNITIQLIRNGSRGLFWLEPLDFCVLGINEFFPLTNFKGCSLLTSR